MVGVCALAMLGGCSQDLVMLEPASNKLATYHVKDMVLHIEGINQSESLQGIVRLTRSDLKNLQSRTFRLQVDTTRPGRWLGLV